MPELATAATATYPIKSKLKVVRSLPQGAEEHTTSTWVGVTLLTETLQREILRSGVRRLQELARLPSNWDSYGSPPLVRSTIDAAVRALAVAAMENAPVPFIGPMGGGGIEFSWDAQDRSLDLALHADGTVEYLAAERGSERDGEIAATLEASVRSLLRWLLAPAP